MGVFEQQQGQIVPPQTPTCFCEHDQFGDGVAFLALDDHHSQGGLSELVAGGSIKADPGMINGWGDDFGRAVVHYGNMLQFEMCCGISRTVSCPPDAVASMAEVAVDKARETAYLSSSTGRESYKKRKADKTLNPKVVSEGKSEEKKMKGCAEEESKTTEQNSNSTNTNTGCSKTEGPSNSGSKAPEYPKSDYIHVRARRGQATDSHSLAERVRREKISERMKYLQDLVPGCNKITGKAGMLDEIINYVQSLQKQVEFLSMKLAAISPTLDFDIDNYMAKEIFQACSSAPMASTSNMVNPDHLQFSTLGQGVSGPSLEMGVNHVDVTLRRTISAPVSIPDMFLDSLCLNQIQHITWEDELQNPYRMECQQGRSAPFSAPPVTGFVEAGRVKLEM